MRRSEILAAALVAFVAWGVGTRPALSTGRWKPTVGLRWQYQLQGTVDAGICAVPFSGGPCVHPDVFDIDLYANDGVTPNRTAVARIHARGAHAVCYIDAGTWENWRPDANRYPVRVLGRPNGWPGERWLDIRATKVLLRILAARVQKCVQAGFDGVDFDNVDGYVNHTGFPLTAAEQLTFDRDLAALAHRHGLAVGLKNDLDQEASLRSAFDFAVNEQCFAFGECAAYDAWTRSAKPVLEIEYTGDQRQYCTSADRNRRDAVHKQLALYATPWQPCR